MRCPARWTAQKADLTIDVVKEQGTTMGKLYDLIQDHLDSQEYDVSGRQLAGRLGVTPTTLANWKTPTKLIEKKHLVSIARVTKVPYQRVLQALLEDIDYWEEGDGDVRRDAAPMNVTKLPDRGQLQKKAARNPEGKK